MSSIYVGALLGSLIFGNSQIQPNLDCAQSISKPHLGRCRILYPNGGPRKHIELRILQSMASGIPNVFSAFELYVYKYICIFILLSIIYILI